MNKNYNPYVIPDGFFEENKLKAMGTYNKKAKRLKRVCLSAAVALVLIVVPVFVKQQVEASGPQVEENSANYLAGLYDYDVFLQVNF